MRRAAQPSAHPNFFHAKPCDPVPNMYQSTCLTVPIFKYTGCRADRFFATAIVVFGTLAVLITAGLDARFGWSAPIGSGLWGLALTLAFGSQMFVLWAMATNPFFATTVRIQGERGHHVVSSGPYQLVRHPGYLGSLIYNLAIPLVLGSLWTFLPALLTIALLVLRTRLEDRTLQAELPGYPEYAAIVRHRLIPGLW